MKKIVKKTKTVEKEIHDAIFQFFEEAIGQDVSTILEISQPPKIEMGHFSVVCFPLEKNFGSNASEISKKLSGEFETKRKNLKELQFFREAKNFGPYLNFFINEEIFIQEVLSQILRQDMNYGDSDFGHGQKIMIEYSQPNTHKEFHVGHLRNVCIGWSLVNLYRTLGFHVLGVNYIGDIGAHVAKCLWAYLNFHKDEKVERNKGKYLGRVYSEAAKKIEENEEYKKESSEIQRRLENGDKKLLSLWKKTRRWSLDDFYTIYRKLGVSFDHYFFESEVEGPGKKIVDDLIKKGIAKKSHGAIIIDLEQHGLKSFLLLKSDGTSLYATKDLALAKLKFEKYKIDRSYIVTDNRQSFYFAQLFKTLEIMGFKKEMAHIAYEFVGDESGVMSSRAGNIVAFEDFESKVIQRAEKETAQRHPDWKKSEVSNSAKAIAYAALKHDMLSQRNESIITFHVERSLNFQGRTGPYLLYVVARISSILKKSRLNFLPRLDLKKLTKKEELGLVTLLAKFPENIQKAALEYEPSILTSYLHDLAKSFSSFYQAVQVLSDDKQERNARLALIRCVLIVMEKGLRILGIKPIYKI